MAETTIHPKLFSLRFVSLAGVVAVAVLTLTYMWSQQQFLLQRASSLEESASTTAAFLSSRAELLNYPSAVLAFDELLINTLASATPDMDQVSALSQHLNAVSTSLGALAVYVMDPAGTTIASSNWQSKDSFVGKNFAFRHYFQNAMTAGTGLNVALGSITSEMGIYASHSVQRLDRTLGVVSIKYPLVLLKRTPPGANAKIVYALADANGVIFDASDRSLLLRTLAPLSKRTQDFIRRNKQYGNAELIPLSFANRRTLGAGELVSLTSLKSPNPFLNQSNQPLIFQTKSVLGTDWTIAAFEEGISSYTDLAFNMTLAFLAYLIALAIFILVRQRKQYLERVYDSAIRDPLTGLYTRLYANEEVPRLIRSHDERGVSNISAVFFDIDHFKNINDTYGHAVGDEVLHQIGNILLNETRANDIAVRLGGEELAIFSQIDSLKVTTDFANRIRKIIDTTTFGRTPKFNVTISGGVVLRRPQESMDAMCERGDALLYKAKESGRNCIVASDTE